MTNAITRRDCLAAMLGLGCGGLPVLAAAQAQAITGVAADKTPRLVCVHGSLTEIVYLLQAGSMLVGTDTTSLYPPAALRTQKVGYMRQLSAEGLLALRPTHVLGTDEAGPPVVLAQLRQAGVPLELAPATHDFDSVRDKVKRVARATRREPQGDALIADLKQRWQAVTTRIAQARARTRAAPRVLFVMTHGGSPLTAGQGTAAHAMLTLAGARNALEGVHGHRPLTAESIAQAQPDILLTTDESITASGGEDGFWQLPGLAYTPAARRGRQGLVSQEAMALLGFGPRLPDVLATLHGQLT